ncbi:hypothetical protein C2G38_2217902 [Gigaspora rosea]|uniref:Uncharacterized protein n=1 Tax=Gigaspora rosea TaxID=44941 RepID=A0A397U785_9GLOM|nr:hypothetical protein C2G38_2217902 [Gigaspora rosea]
MSNGILTVNDPEVQQKNIVDTLDEFDNKAELDIFISSFISWLSKKDRSPFKVESVHNCYSALARYLRENSRIDGGVQIWYKYSFPKSLCCLDGKMKSLQYDGYGDTDKSDSLISNEIISCLNYNYLSIDNNLSIHCGLRGGDIYKLEFRDLERRKDSGIQLRFRQENNNQGEVLYRQRYGHIETRTIPIPPNIKDNQSYGIWYKPVGMGANKLKVMLQQIAINVGKNIDGK